MHVRIISTRLHQLTPNRASHADSSNRIQRRRKAHRETCREAKAAPGAAASNGTRHASGCSSATADSFPDISPAPDATRCCTRSPTEGFDAVALAPDRFSSRRGRESRRSQGLRRAVPSTSRQDRRHHRHAAEFRRRARDRRDDSPRRVERAGAHSRDGGRSARRWASTPGATRSAARCRCATC